MQEGILIILILQTAEKTLGEANHSRPHKWKWWNGDVNPDTPTLEPTGIAEEVGFGERELPLPSCPRLSLPALLKRKRNSPLWAAAHPACLPGTETRAAKRVRPRQLSAPRSQSRAVVGGRVRKELLVRLAGAALAGQLLSSPCVTQVRRWVSVRKPGRGMGPRQGPRAENVREGEFRSTAPPPREGGENCSPGVGLGAFDPLKTGAFAPIGSRGRQ